MKIIEIIKKTPDEAKALLIEAVGGYEQYKAFYDKVGNVDINTKAVDNYNTEMEVYVTFDAKLKKRSIMLKFGFNISQYDYWKAKWKVIKALLKD